MRPVSFEELALLNGGYGVSSVDVDEKEMKIIDNTISKSGLKKHGILILAIERDSQMNPNPSADTKILFGDKLICFGKLGKMREKLYSM